MTTSPRDLYPRTTCGCATCTVGCRTCPGPLIPGDAERIADYCGMKGPEAIGEFVLDHFCASDGGTIVENRNGLLVHRRVPSVVPQQTADGSCVFLRANGECAIHPVSPYGCSHFDTHMSQEQAEPRSRDMLLACEASPGYNALWRMLAGAGKIAKPVQERKDAMYEAELRVRTGT